MVRFIRIIKEGRPGVAQRQVSLRSSRNGEFEQEAMKPNWIFWFDLGAYFNGRICLQRRNTFTGRGFHPNKRWYERIPTVALSFGNMEKASQASKGRQADVTSGRPDVVPRGWGIKLPSKPLCFNDKYLERGRQRGKISRQNINRERERKHIFKL